MPPNDCQSDQTLTLHTSLANLPTVTSHLGGHTVGLTRTPVSPLSHCSLAVSFPQRQSTRPSAYQTWWKALVTFTFFPPKVIPKMLTLRQPLIEI